MQLRSTPLSVHMPPHGLHVLESHHAEDFDMPEQAWPFHKLCFIASGKGEVQHRSTSRPLREGDLFHVPADTPHRFVDQPSSPLTLLILCYAPSAVAAPADTARLHAEFLKICPPLRILRAARYVRERVRDDLRGLRIEQDLRKTGWETATRAQFLLTMTALTRLLPLRDANNRHDLFQLSLTHIEENFFRKLRTADLAGMCDVSERTYSGMFRERMGMTVTEFILEKRIAFAKERLLETGDIAYAAFESGFSDLAHFYRMFKKHCGLPPGKFLARERRR